MARGLHRLFFHLKPFCAAMILLLIFSVPASAEDRDEIFAEGLRAFDGGDYETVRELWQPLAKSGYLDAQLALADLFDRGLGGPVDANRALFWYRLAADQGSPLAFIALGERAEKFGIGKFSTGQIPLAKAYYWYGLAARLKNSYAGEQVRRLRAMISAKQKDQEDARIEAYFAQKK
jgi:TPR repeat protein